MTGKTKLTVYLTETMIAETKMEALRQERTLSWVMERAWLIAREEISKLPGSEDAQEYQVGGCVRG